jgi:hypothetical protein
MHLTPKQKHLYVKQKSEKWMYCEPQYVEFSKKKRKNKK